MVGKLITPVVGAFMSVMTGYAVFAVVLYIANGGGAAGAASVNKMTGQAVGLVTVLIGGLVNLAQAIFRAAMGAM